MGEDVGSKDFLSFYAVPVTTVKIKDQFIIPC